MTRGRLLLFYAILIIPGVFFLFISLVYAKSFLAPLITAIILALLILPVAKKLENITSRALASLLSTFLLFLSSLFFFALFSVQVRAFINDWPEIKSTMKPKIEELKTFIFDHTPLEKKELQKAKGIHSYLFMEPASVKQEAIGFIYSLLNFFGNYLLILIYIYFLLNYRKHFEIFLLKLFPREKKSKVQDIIGHSVKVARHYLSGKLITIAIMAVIYMIGLGILEIENFIFISILVAFFTLIPYLGNVISLFLVLGAGYFGSGDTAVLVGIIITFSIAELVESYILQPYVVGDKVDIHPLLVILGVILGGMTWGIIGMVLAIPVLGICVVVFRNIWVLKPFGFLMSNNELNG